jgi:hypothetical protein
LKNFKIKAILLKVGVDLFPSWNQITSYTNSKAKGIKVAILPHLYANIMQISKMVVHHIFML